MLNTQSTLEGSGHSESVPEGLKLEYHETCQSVRSLEDNLWRAWLVFFALQGFGVKFMLEGTLRQRQGLLAVLVLADVASIVTCFGCVSYLQRMMKRLVKLTKDIGANPGLVEHIRKTLVLSIWLGVLLLLAVAVGDILLYAWLPVPAL